MKPEAAGIDTMKKKVQPTIKNFGWLQTKYTAPTYPNRGLTIVSGKDVYLFDQNGDRYLDLMTNYGVNIFGHGHPLLTARLSSQLKRLTTLHGSFNNDRRAEAAQALVKRCGGSLSRVYFSNSGTEAVEAALKFAVLATGKKRFIACRNGFHGKTLGALSATSSLKLAAPFSPLLWEFEFVEYNRIDLLDSAINKETSAFLVEPVQGEGGIQTPHRDYLTQAKKICASRGALMIVDEIQTGMGRTGRFLSSGKSSVPADILCLGKGLAGGIPAGACLITEEIAETLPRSIHTSTFGGNPLASEGILATLELLDDSLMERIRVLGEYFLSRLQSLKSPLVREIRGSGLILGMEVNDGRDLILKRLQAEKILAVPADQNVVRFLPPFILKEEHVDRTVETLKSILAAIWDNQA